MPLSALANSFSLAFVDQLPGEQVEEFCQRIGVIKVGRGYRQDGVVMIFKIGSDGLVLLLGARIAVIDPLGGQGERTTYANFLRYNASRVLEVLQ